MRTAVSKGRVLRTTFRALRTTSHQPRHHFLTEPQVAAGAGVSLSSVWGIRSESNGEKVEGQGQNVHLMPDLAFPQSQGFQGGGSST